MALAPTVATLALSIMTASYTYTCVRAYSTARMRLLAAVPAFVSFVFAPMIYRGAGYLTASTVAAAVLAWWSASKVFGLAIGRGPLAHVENHAEFVLICLLPVVYDTRSHTHTSSSVVDRDGKEGGPGGKGAHKPHNPLQANSTTGNVLRALIKMPLFLALTWCTMNMELSPGLRRLFYAVMVYLSASLVMDVPAALALGMFGVRLHEHFREPYLSTSLREFWAQRWNITAGTVLRMCVYEPVCDVLEGHSFSQLPADVKQFGLSHPPTPKKKPGPLSTAAAVLVVFFVSGIAHELIFWVPAQVWPLQWMMFFMLHGVLVVVENVALGSWHHKLCQQSAVVRWLSRIYGVGLVLLTADALFFPPAETTGLANALLTEWAQIYKWALALIY